MGVEYFEADVGPHEYVCQYCGDIFRDNSPDRDMIDRIGHDCVEDHGLVEASLAGSFGLIIPQASADVVYVIQSNGHLCEQRPIRGTFVPLGNPLATESAVDQQRLPRPEEGPESGLYSLLLQAQYADIIERKEPNNESQREYVWELIANELPFTYRDAEAPDGYYEDVPAWKWIRITAGTNTAAPSVSLTDVEPLVGKRVLLTYPNFD